MTDLVELNDSTVISLVGNDRFVALFPECVRAYKSRVTNAGTGIGCGRCRREAETRASHDAADQLKRSLLAQPHEKLAALKTMLGTRQIKLTYKASNRRQVEIRF